MKLFTVIATMISMAIASTASATDVKYSIEKRASNKATVHFTNNDDASYNVWCEQPTFFSTWKWKFNVKRGESSFKFHKKNGNIKFNQLECSIKKTIESGKKVVKTAPKVKTYVPTYVAPTTTYAAPSNSFAAPSYNTAVDDFNTAVSDTINSYNAQITHQTYNPYTAPVTLQHNDAFDFNTNVAITNFNLQSTHCFYNGC